MGRLGGWRRGGALEAFFLVLLTVPLIRILLHMAVKIILHTHYLGRRRASQFCPPFSAARLKRSWQLLWKAFTLGACTTSAGKSLYTPVIANIDLRSMAGEPGPTIFSNWCACLTRSDETCLSILLRATGNKSTKGCGARPSFYSPQQAKDRDLPATLQGSKIEVKQRLLR